MDDAMIGRAMHQLWRQLCDGKILVDEYNSATLELMYKAYFPKETPAQRRAAREAYILNP